MVDVASILSYAPIVAAGAAVLGVIMQWGKPWSLTEIEGGYWKLERRQLLPVCLVGEVVRASNLEPYRVVYSYNKRPKGYMKRGDYVIFYISPIINQSPSELDLWIYYRLFTFKPNRAYSETTTHKLLNRELRKEKLFADVAKAGIEEFDRRKLLLGEISPREIRIRKFIERIERIRFTIQNIFVMRWTDSLGKEIKH